MITSRRRSEENQMPLTPEESEELAMIIDETHSAGESSLVARRKWLAENRPIKIRRGRKKKGPPKLSIVAVPRLLPSPPGFEDFAVGRLLSWSTIENDEQLKRLEKRLWGIWLYFLELRCPFKERDPEYAFRYETPDVTELADRIPQLVAQHRRRFGPNYCRLVRENGRAVVAST